MSETPRLALPFLAVGQASKEFTHNEALQTLDMLVGGCVEGPPQTVPPSAPALGAAYLVGAGATGAWSGKAGSVAAWTSGGWRLAAPVEGLELLDRSTQTTSAYRNGAWELGVVRANSVRIGGNQVLGMQQPAINAPVGGSVTDAEARAAIASIIAALQGHGLIG